MVRSTFLFVVASVAVEAYRMPVRPAGARGTRLHALSIEPEKVWGYQDTAVGAATEHLIDEEMVTDDMSASLLADRCMAEAHRLFNSKAGWRKVDVMDPNIHVETIPLDGGYASSGVHLVRGVGIIPASAEKFYEFQISRDGFQSIDEYLVNHRNCDNFKWVTRPEFNGVEKPPARATWPESSPYELMMNRVEWKYPIKRREFVALDIVHKEEMILISKSSLSPLRPGGSRYQSIVPMDEKTPYVDPVDPVKRPLVRAVQVHTSRTFPLLPAAWAVLLVLLVLCAP